MNGEFRVGMGRLSQKHCLPIPIVQQSIPHTPTLKAEGFDMYDMGGGESPPQRYDSCGPSSLPEARCASR